MSKKVILEIRAGAGGDEAANFAGDLVRMYKRFSEKMNWKFSELDSNQTGLDGFKSFVSKIEGENTYEILKNESGVHRVQRVPKTEKNGRVHTSTASVAVILEVESKEIQINSTDLEISFFRSSGPGGQNVNKVETAVRILHKPSGVVVSCQTGRSQHANREEAMSVLSSKLYEAMKEQKAAEIGALRKEQIGSMERAEKIRTYNFPDDRITDHRIGKKWHNIERILGGDLNPIIKAFQKQEDK